MAEKLFPHRQRCKTCRSLLGITVDEEVLLGRYCSVSCAGMAKPATKVEDAPRGCRTQRGGRWVWKKRYRSEQEIPGKLRKDPSTNWYWCEESCGALHLGHSRIGGAEAFRMFTDVADIGDFLAKRRGQATRKQVAEAAGVPSDPAQGARGGRRSRPEPGDAVQGVRRARLQARRGDAGRTMTTMTTGRIRMMRMSRRGMLTAAVIAGLTLSGCTGGEQQTPDDSTSSSPAESTATPAATATPTKTDGPPRAEASLVVAGPDVELSTTEVSDGTKGDIIVPTGTVTVSSVKSVEKIPGELVDATGTVLPAEGSEFVLVTISYDPAKLKEGSVAAGLDDPLLELTRGEDAQALDLPKAGEPATYLFSVPSKEKATIGVAQSGLTQRVDLADGQRIKNPVAKTYYRSTRAVDVKAGPTTPPATVKVVHDAGNAKDVTLSLDTRVTRVELSPWVEGKGWALEGTAWLTIDGSLERQSNSGVLFPGQTQAKFTVEYGDDKAKAAPLTLPAEQSSGEVPQAVTVPVDIKSATLVVTAGVEVFPRGGYTVQGPSPVMFVSERVEVDLGSPVS